MIDLISHSRICISQSRLVGADVTLLGQKVLALQCFFLQFLKGQYDFVSNPENRG